MGRRERGADGRGRFERFLFSFMGPPELGDPSAPVRDVPAAPVLPCPQCGAPYDEHEVVRSARLTYSRCPPRRTP